MSKIQINEMKTNALGIYGRAILAVGILLTLLSACTLSNNSAPLSLTQTPVTTTTLVTSKTYIELDFQKCSPYTDRIYLPFGSVSIEIIGFKENKCALKYGGEVENPKSKGGLIFSCSVPQSLGVQRFAKTNYSIDFRSIQDYCETIEQ